MSSPLPSALPRPPNARPAAAPPRRGQTVTAFLLRPLLLPLLLLAGVGGAVVQGVGRQAQSTALVTGAQARLTLITAAARDVSDLETGQRGYVITGDEAYLRPYRLGHLALAQHLGALRRASVTDRQRENIGRVEALVRTWDETAAAPEIGARRRSLTEAVARVSDGRGRRTLEEARQVIAEMQQNENARLQAAVKQSTETLLAVQGLSVLGLLLSVLLAGGAALRAARTVAGALRDLAAGAGRIAAGQYGERLPPTPLRELRLLGEQFHLMAAAVQSREEALEASTRALRATNEELLRSNRELEQFAYVASHDLQEPLRTVGSYTELLARRYRGQLDERADRYIDFTLSATARLKALIQDLLAYSRVRQSDAPLAPVDTAVLALEVAGDLRAQVQEAGASVTLGELPTVHSNASLLRNLLLNLIGNALKFRAPGRAPEVRVWARREAQGWVFGVQDNGIGIEPQYFERIFGVFQRLHPVGEYGGSGIGLAVARTAAERLGGRLWLESRPGEGSTFFFSVPDPAGRPSHALPQEAPHP